MISRLIVALVVTLWMVTSLVAAPQATRGKSRTVGASAGVKAVLQDDGRIADAVGFSH